MYSFHYQFYRTQYNWCQISEQNDMILKIIKYWGYYQLYDKLFFYTIQNIIQINIKQKKMKILILPSHRLMLYSSKNTLTLLPEYLKAEQYCSLPSSNLLATLHYKTVSLFRTDYLKELGDSIRLGKLIAKVQPQLEQTLPKKIAVIDLYQKIVNGQTTDRCVLSDKFGDLYLLPLNKQNHQPIYLNSNLGIPNYIHELSTSKSSYFILADQQNRIKVYNSNNPHQLISFWFLINKSSIQCEILKGGEFPVIVMLMKIQNKITLETDIRIQYLEGSQKNLQADQYGGVEVKNYNKFGKQCRFYTMITYSVKSQKKLVMGSEIPQHSTHNTNKNSILLLFLYTDKITYELFVWGQGELKSKLIGQIAIEEGKWDYLHAIDTEQNDTILLTYGADVEMPIDIQIGNKNDLHFTVDMNDGAGVSLNKYEKIAKIQLKF